MNCKKLLYCYAFVQPKIGKFWLGLIMIYMLGLASCQKDHPVSHWENIKEDIKIKVATSLQTLKISLRGNLAKDNANFVVFARDEQKLNSVSNSKRAVVLNSDRKDLYTKGQHQIIKISGGGPVVEAPVEVPKIDPLAVLTHDGFRNLYYIATQEYTDLTTYITKLNDVQSMVSHAFYLPQDYKEMLYTEIEMLKQYATDLELNQEYWIDLYEPKLPTPLDSNNVGNKTGDYSNSNRLLSAVPPPKQPKRKCQINVRNVLLISVVGGVTRGVIGAIAGGGGGTIVFPVVGTVTGSVAGFMVGFAIGFTSGVISGVSEELLTSCTSR